MAIHVGTKEFKDWDAEHDPFAASDLTSTNTKDSTRARYRLR
ncbi:hypothetical protein ABZ904_36465 [Streptomyces sp. NPDC046900]